jgi:hypothetical protein
MMTTMRPARRSARISSIELSFMDELGAWGVASGRMKIASSSL